MACVYRLGSLWESIKKILCIFQMQCVFSWQRSALQYCIHHFSFISISMIQLACNFHYQLDDFVFPNEFEVLYSVFFISFYLFFDLFLHSIFLSNVVLLPVCCKVLNFVFKGMLLKIPRNIYFLWSSMYSTSDESVCYS